MRTDVALNGNTSPISNYIGWTPAPATVRLSDPGGAIAPVKVKLRNARPGTGGQTAFNTDGTWNASDELELDLPIDGTPVPFYALGEVASIVDKDAAIEVVDAQTGAQLSVTQLMVRVRKDANALTDVERDLFVATLATFNNKGMGRFSEFRDMHDDSAYYEAHVNFGFLSWHRAYLLDLERELQAIEPGVALPYWRFDLPAPRIFDLDFLGVSGLAATVTFSGNNPLQYWKTDGVDGIDRTPWFDPLLEPAFVISQEDTILYGNTYAPFTQMEIDPHGNAHGSFGGFLTDPTISPRDPLFFLLHCNVDRLWALWQWRYDRFDITSADTYTYLGKYGDPGSIRIGHNLLDTMWPWNGEKGNGGPFERPPTPAPGGGLARSFMAAPSVSPTVGDMVDYQGRQTAATRMGFDYFDVPFAPYQP